MWRRRRLRSEAERDKLRHIYRMLLCANDRSLAEIERMVCIRRWWRYDNPRRSIILGGESE